MKRYEYKHLFEGNGINVDRELNELGKLGWKLVAVRRSGDNSFLHLRRKLKKSRELETELTTIKGKLVQIVEKVK